jgi:hypothetical protein
MFLCVYSNIRITRDEVEKPMNGKNRLSDSVNCEEQSIDGGMLTKSVFAELLKQNNNLL